MKMTEKKSGLNPHKARLTAAGLRPTRQRLQICAWLFDGADKHFTAEQLFRELNPKRAGKPLSLATVYNTLKGFTEAGLLSTLSVDNGRLYYDTNTTHHYHVYDTQRRLLADIDASTLDIKCLKGWVAIAEGQEVECIDVIVRTRPKT